LYGRIKKTLILVQYLKLAKMKTRTLVLFVLLIMMPTLSYGQLRGLLKNAASRTLGTVGKESAKEAARQADSIAQIKAQKAANAAIAAKDSASKQVVDQSNQSVGQASQGQQQSQGQGGMNIGKFFGGKIDLKYNDEYSFASRLYMQTESYEKKGAMKMDLYMYYSANSPSVGMETKSVTDDQGKTTPVASSMVMDGENKCFIILTDLGSTKIGIISAIPDANSTQNQSDGTPAKKATPTNFTKTGNTKVIAGYKCDEYTYSNPDDKTSGKVWFTKDANLQIDKRGWQRTGMGAYYGYAGFDGGIILATEVYDAQGNLTMKSETKEIDPDFAHSITVKGYPLRQVNLNQGQPKK
jgi:hypothetical protein